MGEHSMRYKLLGKSGMRVSEIALGTMTFGEEWGFGVDKAACQKLLDTYREAGGNFLDTANKYTEGSSERIIGELIADNRHRWVVATKYTLSMDGSDPNASGNHRKNLKRAVDASLERLNTDYIDLLWVHAWDFTTPASEVMRALDDVIRAGKVLHIGISDAPAWVVSHANTLAELRGWSSFVGLQVEYSLIERTVERDLLPMANHFGLSVTPWGAIGGGILTGKYTRGEAPEVDTKRDNTSRKNEHNFAIAREVDAVADAIGVSSTQVALAWVRQRGDNVIPLIGARKPEQLVDSLGSVDVSLEDEHMARLNAASPIKLGFPHDFIEVDYIRRIVYSDKVDQIDWDARRAGAPLKNR